MSKLPIIAAAASLLVLGACQPASKDTVQGSSQQPAASVPASASAVAPFLGKQLIAENGTVFTFSNDGVVGGTLDGAPIVGVYSATASEVCSIYTAPERLSGREYCSTPQIDGDMVIFVRRDGSRSQQYRITEVAG